LLTLRCPYAVLNPRLDVAAMNNKVKVSNPGAPCTCGIWIKPGEPDEHWPDCARVSPTPEPPAGQYCEHGVRSDLRCFSCNPASSQPPPAVRYWEYLDKYAPDHVSEASAFLVKLMCDYADRRGSGEAKAAMIGTAVDFLSQWAMLQPCSTATKGPDVCSGCGHVFPIAPDHPAYGKPCPEEKCPRSGEGENHER
jgi:hypothetical protein